MWRCKKCGGTEFIEFYKSGYRKFSEYDRNGDAVEDSLCEDVPELYIECEECCKYGLKLKDIAEWKEEENE